MNPWISAKEKKKTSSYLCHLFHKLKVEPTSKIEIEYDGSRLIKLFKIEDEDDILPPPLSILHVNVHTLTGKINPEDQIIMISLRYEDLIDPKQNAETLFDSKCERDILQAFSSYVHYRDPDIIVFEVNHFAGIILDYLFARMLKLGLDLSLGREEMKTEILASLEHPGKYWTEGGLVLNNKTVNRYSFWTNLDLQD